MLGKTEAASVPLVAPVRPPARLLHVIFAAAQSVLRRLERRRQLRDLAELARLNDHLLRDIGLSREDVERACSKSFWM